MFGHVLGPPLFVLKIAHSRVGIWIPSNARFLGPARVNSLNGISIGSAVLAGLTVVMYGQTDRPTDHATPSVAIGRIPSGDAA